MTTKADFENKEWDMIMGAPVLAGSYIMMGDISGPINLGKEMQAMETFFSQPYHGENLLVRSVYAEMNDLLTRAHADPVDPNLKSELEIRADSQKDAFKKVRSLEEAFERIFSPVNDKIPADELAGFKQWLYEVALTVAKAAKDGGFLWLGMKDISDQEDRLLGELAGVLGVSR